MAQRTKTKKKTRLWRKLRGFAFLLWPLGGLSLIFARWSEDFAETVFAQGIYPLWHRLAAAATGWLPFSLAELLLYALLLFVPWALISWLLHIKKAKKRGPVLWNGLLNGLCALGVVLFLFVFGCGGNYYRSPYAQIAGMRLGEATTEDLYGLCQSLSQQAAQLRESLPEDRDGVFTLSCTPQALGEQAVQALNELSKTEPLLSVNHARPKPVFFSKGLSYLGIAGFYSPFTAEANLNMDAPDYGLGASMCHELCHGAGFMREGEANYLAYRACLSSPEPALRYSGLMLALSYSANALRKAAPELYGEVYDGFSQGMRRDFAANTAYWTQFEDSPTSKLGEQVNDAYLKANKQSAGTQSYGEMVELLLADYRAKGK